MYFWLFSTIFLGGQWKLGGGLRGTRGGLSLPPGSLIMATTHWELKSSEVSHIRSYNNVRRKQVLWGSEQDMCMLVVSCCGAVGLRACEFVRLCLTIEEPLQPLIWAQGPLRYQNAKLPFKFVTLPPSTLWCFLRARTWSSVICVILMRVCCNTFIRLLAVTKLLSNISVEALA